VAVQGPAAEASTSPVIEGEATGYLAWIVATALLGDVRRDSPWLIAGRADAAAA
jgi:hypothetical protein